MAQNSWFVAIPGEGIRASWYDLKYLSEVKFLDASSVA